MSEEPNVLYYGDNLNVLRLHVQDESVDLVYLDPPFNSNATYNVLFKEHGVRAAAQVRAFEDTWEWNLESRAAYEEIVEQGGRVAETMRAFRTMVGDSDMLAYLSMMAPRLVELRRVLKNSGSLYLHCDATASHHLKLLLDAVFGPDNFRNEIIWSYRRWSAGSRQFQRQHDTLLFYSCGKSPVFNVQYEPYTAGTLKRWKGIKRKTTIAEDGKLIQVEDTEGTQGANMGDVWPISILNANAKERLGYPTQKPEALLERIILASSNDGDTVLDPFCGCGTTVAVAQRLERRWIGIDVTHVAIGLIKNRLATTFGPEVAKEYGVVGEPETVDDAAVLAREDPFQFQAWALGLAGARVAGSNKKGGDKGIDGKLFFHDSPGTTRQIVFSVKAGHLVPTYLRDLRGVIDREEAEIGVLISFEEPTAGMRSEAASAGFYTSPWGKHPRLQLRTVEQLLDGREIDYPHMANVTHRRASKAHPKAPEALNLFGAHEAAEEQEPYDSN